MRVVLDTDVMVAAIRSNLGASRRLLEGCLTKQFTLLASVPLLIEYQAVMTRLEHLQVSRLTAREIGVILAFLW
jgi:predicted nucleic acid-binding protein